MLRLKNLVNKYQKRTLRVLYGQTQAYPYAATLDATIGTGSTFRKPLASDTAPTYPLSRTVDAFTLKNGLIPGTVLVKDAAETVAVHNGINDGTVVTTFGLLANFVGGDLDELGDESSVGVWRGPDSVYELLAPAFNSTGLAAAYSAATAGAPVKLYAGRDGLLCVAAGLSGGTANAATPVVANLIDNPSTSRIVVDLRV